MRRCNSRGLPTKYHLLLRPGPAAAALLDYAMLFPVPPNKFCHESRAAIFHYPINISNDCWLVCSMFVKAVKQCIKFDFSSTSAKKTSGKWRIRAVTFVIGSKYIKKNILHFVRSNIQLFSCSSFL